MMHNWHHHINCVLNGNLTFLKYQSLVLSAKFGGCVKTFLQYDILLEGGGRKKRKSQDQIRYPINMNLL